MTDQERKAMEMALDALENNLPLIEDYGSKEQLNIHHKAIAALYKTLAQPEPWDTSDMAHRPGGLSMEQEPFGYVYEINGAHTEFSKELPPDDAYDEGTLVPVFAAPPSKPWVGLTMRDYHEFLNLGTFEAFKAIEAALKEKNNG